MVAILMYGPAGTRAMGHLGDLAQIVVEAARVRARHHGGTIRVESPADGGTRMVVSLPREQPQRLTAAPVAPSSRRSA